MKTTRNKAGSEGSHGAGPRQRPGSKVDGSLIFELGLTLLLGIGAFAFFAFLYPGHLHYHEDLQLFQFTGAYAAKVIGVPGGLAQYVSRFVVQFYYHAALGAALLGVLLMACQRLTWRLMCRRTVSAYGLSLLPALLMWAQLCHEDALPSALIALLLAQLAAWGTYKIVNTLIQAILWVVCTPVLYFLAGPIAWVYTIIVGIRVWVKEGRLPACDISCKTPQAESKTQAGSLPTLIGIKCGATGAAVTAAALCPVLASVYFPYPMDALVRGIGYMRYQVLTAEFAWLAAAAVPAVMLLSLAFTEAPATRKSWRFATLVTLLTLLAGMGAVSSCYDTAKETVYRYHMLAGQQKWKEIIRLADKSAPNGPVQMTYTNLALAMTNQLNERLMDYPQNGTAGLMAPFGDHFFPPFATAEAFYHAGLVKPAMHYTYEIQQSVPDAQMSARCTRRLAELHLANGDTALARKYLKALEHSLYYSNWAKQQLKKCVDMERTASLRPAESSDGGIPVVPASPAGRRPTVPSMTEPSGVEVADSVAKATFFDPTDISSVLQATAESDPANSRAFNYLVAWRLLDRDIEPLPEIMALPAAKGAEIPLALQQALALQWSHDHTSWEGLPWPISDPVKSLFIDFSNVYTPGINIKALPDKLLNTYWAYYFND